METGQELSQVVKSGQSTRTCRGEPGRYLDIRNGNNRARQQSLVNYQRGYALPLLQELFERLYVLRQQVFHGAATSGSKLNRETVETGTAVLTCIVPAMIEIMLSAGATTAWGEVCFPPIDHEK